MAVLDEPFSWIQAATFLGAAFVGASCFAVSFRTPRRYFFHTVSIGFLAGIGIHSLPSDSSAGSVGFSTLIVAAGVGGLSHIFARWTRIPAQSFLIPGVMFLVPGTYIYRAFSKALEEDFRNATVLFLAAVTITFGISFGLLLATWLVPPKKTL
jgi:uncharacterized membrane protein YjjB (DUF3815 family)